MPVNNQRHYETAGASALREAKTIRIMLGDFDRTRQLLDGDIAAEEERTRISDRSDAKYPILARTLIERRDNIKMTIAALEEPSHRASAARTSSNCGLAARKSRRWVEISDGFYLRQ
jgi:hypothetical protein